MISITIANILETREGSGCTTDSTLNPSIREVCEEAAYIDVVAHKGYIDLLGRCCRTITFCIPLCNLCTCRQFNEDSRCGNITLVPREYCCVLTARSTILINSVVVRPCYCQCTGGTGAVLGDSIAISADSISNRLCTLVVGCCNRCS